MPMIAVVLFLVVLFGYLGYELAYMGISLGEFASKAESVSDNLWPLTIMAIAAWIAIAVYRAWAGRRRAPKAPKDSGVL